MATKKETTLHQLTNREVWEMYNDKRYWFTKDKRRVYKQTDDGIELYAQSFEVDWSSATEVSAINQLLQKNTVELRKLREAIEKENEILSYD